MSVEDVRAKVLSIAGAGSVAEALSVADDLTDRVRDAQSGGDHRGRIVRIALVNIRMQFEPWGGPVV